MKKRVTVGYDYGPDNRLGKSSVCDGLGFSPALDFSIECDSGPGNGPGGGQSIGPVYNHSLCIGSGSVKRVPNTVNTDHANDDQSLQLT